MKEEDKSSISALCIGTCGVQQAGRVTAERQQQFRRQLWRKTTVAQAEHATYFTRDVAVGATMWRLRMPYHRRVGSGQKVRDECLRNIQRQG